MENERGDIVMRVGVGEVHAMVVAEGSSWNPDIARDLVNRLSELWTNTVTTAIAEGLIDLDPYKKSECECEECTDDEDEDDTDEEEDVEETSNARWWL